MMDPFVPIPLKTDVLSGRFNQFFQKAHRPHMVLSGQLFTTSGSAAINHTAPAFCRHAFAKAVGSRPFNFARLKCPFHASFPFIVRCSFIKTPKRLRIINKYERLIILMITPNP
jgi:hypothetical protein